MSNIKGLAELNKQLENLGEINIPRASLAGALVLQRYSQINAPVDTGFLRNSAESRKSQNGAELEFAANYSYYVEFGTSKMEAQPYVRPAIDGHFKEIVEAVKEEVQKDINKGIK